MMFVLLTLKLTFLNLIMCALNLELIHLASKEFRLKFNLKQVLPDIGDWTKGKFRILSRIQEMKPLPSKPLFL